MKKNTVIQVLLLAFVLTAGCKKDGDSSNVLKEDFISVHLLPGNGWKFVNNNLPGITAEWRQGNAGYKGYSGFEAKSYKNSPDEYAFISGNYASVGGPADISSWMITPSVRVRNGDIIRFYTRSAAPGGIDRLQLLLNEMNDSYDVGNTHLSVGVFTKILLDLNANQTVGAFPADWTLNTVTLTGLNGTLKTRLAFRYVVNGIQSSGVGVDEFSIRHN